MPNDSQPDPEFFPDKTPVPATPSVLSAHWHVTAPGSVLFFDISAGPGKTAPNLWTTTTDGLFEPAHEGQIDDLAELIHLSAKRLTFPHLPLPSAFAADSYLRRTKPELCRKVTLKTYRPTKWFVFDSLKITVRRLHPPITPLSTKSLKIWGEYTLNPVAVWHNIARDDLAMLIMSVQAYLTPGLGLDPFTSE